MKDQEIDERLKRVQRVDPPPFLFTRIEARLAAGMPVPRPRLVLVACALLVLLLTNIVVLTRSSGSSDLGGVVDVMGMNTTNQLYE